MNAGAPVLTIWYDASCPLCRIEMHALLRHAPDGSIALVDCSPPAFHDAAVDAAGFTRAGLMRLIHARDAGGNWLRGVAVFERAYRLAGMNGVARAFGHPWLRPAWDRVYPWVARHRMALSRLGLNALYGWVIERAARRAARRAKACAAGRCEVDSKRF